MKDEHALGEERAQQEAGWGLKQPGASSPVHKVGREQLLERLWHVI